MTSFVFLSTQSTNHWTVLRVVLTTLCLKLVPLLPKCFWVEIALVWWRVNIFQAGRTLLRQPIGQFSELFLPETLAQFHDSQWDCLCPHFSWVLWLKMILVLLRKSSQLLLICLPLGFVTWLHCHLLSIQSIWIHLWWGCLWLSGRFRLLLEGFWLTVGSHPCRSFAEPFWRDFRRWLLYLSPLGARRKLPKSANFCPKNVACILIDFNSPLWIFSP